MRKVTTPSLQLQLDSPTVIPLAYPQMLTAIASLLGAGAYLDAKYGVRYDLRKLQQQREQTKRIGERIRELGNEATLYRLLECPEMAFVIYALGKIGAVAALLNNALRSRGIFQTSQWRLLISWQMIR